MREDVTARACENFATLFIFWIWKNFGNRSVTCRLCWGNRSGCVMLSRPILF